MTESEKSPKNASDAICNSCGGRLKKSGKTWVCLKCHKQTSQPHQDTKLIPEPKDQDDDVTLA